MVDKLVGTSSGRRAGFTIVELLIVIVVIGVLAAITIVAYNGIQSKANYSVMQQDISSINKAIQLYYADNGHYPYSGTSGGAITASYSTAPLNIPGLIPQYIQTMPKVPNDGKGAYYAYIWSANGTDYKILRLAPTSTGGPVDSNLPDIEKNDPRKDPTRGRGWGYWSSGGSQL